MIEIRPYCPGDSVEELTILLNRANAELADMGLRYVATWQTPDMTAEMLPWGTCLLATDGERLVGTVTLFPTEPDGHCPFYAQPGVFHFGKFAVDPDRRGEGIGRKLFEAAENLAREQGATTLACDTAEQAKHLIRLYESWGFKVVDLQDWTSTNYISVILDKHL
jgi:GNAT superfamily N-acetyltransferase